MYSYIAIAVLSALCSALLLFARWFDRRHYIPFLAANLIRRKKDPVYVPNLLNAGLLAAGGGLLIWSLAGAVWLWAFNR